MTIADLRAHAVKRGMNEDQIKKLLFPYKLSQVITEQREAGMNRREILSNCFYITEREFSFDVAVNFCPLVEDYFKTNMNEPFSVFFMQKAKDKQKKA